MLLQVSSLQTQSVHDIQQHTNQPSSSLYRMKDYDRCHTTALQGPATIITTTSGAVDPLNPCSSLVVVDSQHKQQPLRPPCSSTGSESTTISTCQNAPYKIAAEQTHATSGGMSRSKTLQSFNASSYTTSSNDSSIDNESQRQQHQYEHQSSSWSSNSSLPLHRRGSPSSLSSSSECSTPDFTTFGMDIRRYTNESPEALIVDTGMRHVLEPHMRKARIMREQARQEQPHSPSLAFHNNTGNPTAIASSVGVPYVKLRQERPFLYDTYTYPLHEILSETLGVQELSKLHETNVDLDTLMNPLRIRKGRKRFQESYDNFVTSFCIPLLHSLAMTKNLFHSVNQTSRNTRISYRYQAFPSLRIVRPGDASIGPLCDTVLGHSIGCLRFHVPLTPSFGTNALYTETYPGKEDWHPLSTKSVGLGFLFDGARCISFNVENTTNSTLVALDFVVAIYTDDDPYSESPMMDAEGLCTRMALEDQYTMSGPGFYDEAVIDLRLGSSPLWQMVAKKHRFIDRQHKLLDPDARVGFPFG